MVTLAKIGLHALLIALATGAVHAQESGRELLGKARNLNLDELLKPYNAPSSAPPSAAREIKQERTLTPAEAAAAETLALPIYGELALSQQQAVVAAVGEFVHRTGSPRGPVHV